MGGNILNGALAGAIAGASMGAAGGLGLGPVGTAIVGGAAGGALGALAIGGDPAMGALTGGLTAGILVSFNITPVYQMTNPSTSEYLKQLALHSGVGAGVGGVAVEIQGGKFSQGAEAGAKSAGTGFVISTAYHSYFSEEAQSKQFNKNKNNKAYLTKPKPWNKYWQRKPNSEFFHPNRDSYMGTPGGPYEHCEACYYPDDSEIYGAMAGQLDDTTRAMGSYNISHQAVDLMAHTGNDAISHLFNPNYAPNLTEIIPQPDWQGLFDSWLAGN